MRRKRKSLTPDAPLAPVPSEILDQFVRQGPISHEDEAAVRRDQRARSEDGATDTSDARRCLSRNPSPPALNSSEIANEMRRSTVVTQTLDRATRGVSSPSVPLGSGQSFSGRSRASSIAGLVRPLTCLC